MLTQAQPFRLPPRLPVGAVKTYRVASPLATHWRPATCAEVDCDAWRNGWRTTIDPATPTGQAQLRAIADYCHPLDAPSQPGDTRRRYIHTIEAGRWVYTFPPGQTCFAAHQTSLERPELYVVRGGDWRGNPRGEARQHPRPELWVEDFAEHQDTLAEASRKG